MKNFVRATCAVLALCLVLAVPVYTRAAGDQRASLFFMAHRVYIFRTGGNNFEACFDVTGNDIMQEIGAKSLSVQRSKDGEKWATVQTYTSDNYPQMIAENTTTHDGFFTRTAISGYYYRLEVVLWAKDSRGTGEMTVYSVAVRF